MPGLELQASLAQQQITTFSLLQLADFYADHCADFRKVNRLADIEKYVQVTANALFNGQVHEQIAQRLMVCLGIFCYVDPICSLNLRNTRVCKSFIDSAKRHPYYLPESLVLEYVPCESNPAKDSFFDTNLFGRVVSISAPFEQRDTFVGELRDRRNTVYTNLRGDDRQVSRGNRGLAKISRPTVGYTKESHHELAGINDVCMPLFYGRENLETRESFTKYLRSLELHWGAFRQPFPVCLQEFLPPEIFAKDSK